MIIGTIDAIFAINPNAMCIVPRNDIDRIIWTEGTAPIAKADIEAKIVELQAVEDARVAQEEADKTNGNQKLLDLGLTQAEVDALVSK